jgi:hypothetical protein
MLTEVRYFDLEYLALNMRPEDWVEIANMSRDPNPLVIAEELYAALSYQGIGRIGWVKGRPAGVIGLVEEWPGVWAIVMFGTDDLGLVGVELLKWLRKGLRQVRDELGGWRCHCDSREGNELAHKMIRAMGGRAEHDMIRSGSDGSRYTRFSWLLGENDQVIAAA